MVQHRHETTIIKNGTTHSILADAYWEEERGKRPLVIFCHGYKGFKDWGAWDLMMQTIAKAGYVAVKFNFSHNGTSLDQPMEFVDLEAFGKNTYTQEQNDLAAVIDFYQVQPYVEETQIFLIGHSRGGGAVLLQTYYNDKVTGAISLAGVADFKKRFPQRDNFELWQKEGVFYSMNGRTKQQMPHYLTFWEDFEANEQALTIQYAAQNLRKPVLIVNGTADQAVGVKEAELLHLWMKESTLYVVEGADHVFGAKHPYEQAELPVHLKLVVDEILGFLKENTKAKPNV
ncbi:dienelactone hydrolase family protein [Myroides sp. NP-2]|uniref:alpha/beta hydrolase family protein n=1 Tax=Myroides sp. NP-2 TaxID=2759945 RepID=UPI0015FB165A|nr:alpha/beta fold hydrolase [Myroides sp. NP-2]MBB1149569.1 dienelactone hydrolase family protein [Myroides sp. NP-2]